MKNIAIFASGRGSNAINIHEHALRTGTFKVVCILSNKKDAPVLDYAISKGIDHCILDRTDFYKSTWILDYLKARQVDVIVLAGFLWLIPEYLLDAFSNKIINIHPSLLPKYGGKGMYGIHVHQAVKDNNDPVSGITIHVVNSEYDKGRVILQSRVVIDQKDSPAHIAQKVLKLEHHFYPKVIEGFVSQV